MIGALGDMDALPMSKAQCRHNYLQENHKPYDKIVIGALIFKQHSTDSTKILLLKRAAHEDSYPNVFEIPGGKVEESDPTILDAVKREVFEEAGLAVDEVVGTVGSFDYSMEKSITNKEGVQESILSTSLQLNFICHVTTYEVAVNPDEHSEGGFFSRSQIADLNMTDRMRAVVEEGFVWAGGDEVDAVLAKV
ncbi:MAG: hypothetical protein Q9171_002998 [Xanthocarpia ochracea]